MFPSNFTFEGRFIKASPFNAGSFLSSLLYKNVIISRVDPDAREKFVAQFNELAVYRCKKSEQANKMARMLTDATSNNNYVNSLVQAYTVDMPAHPLHGQQGVCAKVTIPKECVLGIYPGLIDIEDNDLRYQNSVLSYHEESYYFGLNLYFDSGKYCLSKDKAGNKRQIIISGRQGLVKDNPLPLINDPAGTENKANVYSYEIQFEGVNYIVYCTNVEIAAGNPLWIEYGESYWQKMKRSYKIELESAKKAFQSLSTVELFSEFFFLDRAMSKIFKQVLPQGSDNVPICQVILEQEAELVSKALKDYSKKHDPALMNGWFPGLFGMQAQQNSEFNLAQWVIDIINNVSEQYYVIPIQGKDDRYGIVFRYLDKSVLIVWLFACAQEKPFRKQKLLLANAENITVDEYYIDTKIENIEYSGAAAFIILDTLSSMLVGYALPRKEVLLAKILALNLNQQLRDMAFIERFNRNCYESLKNDYPTLPPPPSFLPQAMDVNIDSSLAKRKSSLGPEIKQHSCQRPNTKRVKKNFKCDK